jgi:DNA-3-methyladenine glycosylase
MSLGAESNFVEASALDVAPRLLGCILERELDGHTIRVRIVETEAYDQTDVASHSYKGRTRRTDVMFGPAGHLYVYFTYGMHYCCNVVVGQEGHGAAVLIRAVEPLDGHDILRDHRGNQRDLNLTNGPAKLCQAMAIDTTLNGHDLHCKPLRLISGAPLPARKITQTTRIGITHATDLAWRFYETDNPYVSKH